MDPEKDLSSIELKFAGRAEDPFERALKRQMALHEGVTFMDLLKFLYQSALGPFHLFEMMDETELKGWIRRNLEETKPSDGPLTEELYGKKWIRVNFGPYKTRFGNDFHRICKALAKAKSIRAGQLEEYTNLLKKLVGAIRKGKIKPVTEDRNILSLVENFLAEYQEKDYPPIHHSETYMLGNTSEYLVVPYSSPDKIG
jgi:hypothetical protein